MFKDIEAISTIGVGKCKMAREDPKRFMFRAFMGGTHLGIAVMLAYTFGCLLYPINQALCSIAIAACFGFGVVLTINLGAELFIGNSFTTMIPFYNKQVSIKDVLLVLFYSFIGNSLGNFIFSFLYIQTGSHSELFKPFIEWIVTTRLDYEIIPLFVKAILAGYLVTISIYASQKCKDETNKFFITMVCILAYVLATFQNCTINVGVFTCGYLVLGNSVSCWSALPLHMIITTIGNALGGSIMLAYPVYEIFKEKQN